MLVIYKLDRHRSSAVYQRWAARFLTLGVAAVLIVGVTAYAAGGVITYLARSLVVGPAKAIPMAAVPQMPNRMAKADRAALLLNSPSYTNFSPSFVALAFSPAAAAPDPSNAPGNLNGLLNDAQIVGIEKRLRLTPQQAKHWPAVAAALRSLGRRYFQSGRRHQYAAPKIDVNSPEVQRLIETAMPLIQELSDDQKREVRQLVRLIGLETIASQII
jgi:hypothetical protein